MKMLIRPNILEVLGTTTSSLGLAIEAFANKVTSRSLQARLSVCSGVRASWISGGGATSVNYLALIGLTFKLRHFVVKQTSK